MKKSWTGCLFLAPAVLHLFVFALLPIGYALFLSVFKWDILKPDKPFVGAKNYLDTLTDSAFWNAMWNSTKFALVSVPAGLAVALFVAVLVTQRLRGMAFFRTVFYIPAVSSGVAISILWIYIYLPTSGLIASLIQMLNTGIAKLNQLLHLSMSLLPTDIDFLNDKAWALWALAFMGIWTGLGPRMVLFSAGLLGIPRPLYEAAELDGASRWQCFRQITLPMLTPTTFFVLITSTIGAFQLFTPVYMMTQGNPEDSTRVIGYHIYEEAWSRFHVGLASAQSFVLMVPLFFIALMQERFMRRRLEGFSIQ
jgi:multiple sugar transport system permease protein